MARSCTVLFIVTVLSPCLTGCATAHGPRRVDDATTAAWPWSRVGELRPGTEIEIETAGAPMRDRIFVSATDSNVTVLSLETRSLPRTATDTLQDMAARHPEYFAPTQTGSSFEQNRVRIGREGVFVADQRIAAFADVVETLPRASVREIRGPVVARGSVTGTIIGGWLGFSVGVVPALGGANPGAARALLAGAVALGGWLGHHWSNHAVGGVVYRASQ